MNIAVILAGGVGKRFSSKIPKQFSMLNGKTCLEHTLSVFFVNKNIDKCIIVLPLNWINFTREFLKKYNFEYSLIPGGENRNQSCFNALQSIIECDNIIIHDAVRPCINSKIINQTLLALDHYEAVTVAVPAVDTILKVDNEIVVEIPNRNEFFHSQTPQGFKFKIIKSAYEAAYKDNPDLCGFSDDCGVLKKYFPNKKIKIIRGNFCNLKLTTTKDLSVIQNLLLNNSFNDF